MSDLKFKRCKTTNGLNKEKPATIMLIGHSDTVDWLFRQIQIAVNKADNKFVERNLVVLDEHKIGR
jgi:hypothetical protein